MRLEITKKTDLVLRAMCSLAAHEGRMTASAVAGDINASRQIVPKLMEPMVKAGWVDSTPGPSGGYVLGVDLEDISLLDLIEAVEGPTDNRRCVLRGTECPAIEPCAIHDAWVPARDALLDKLRATSIADISESPAMCGPAVGNRARKAS